MDLVSNSHVASASAPDIPPLTKPRSRSSKKTRSACDRCHFQKLKCVIQDGKIGCDRCLRLKTLCWFSPRAPRTSLRPKLRGEHFEHAQDGLQEPLSFSGLMPSPAPNTPSGPLITTVTDGDIRLENTFTEMQETTDVGFYFPMQTLTVDILNTYSLNDVWEPGLVDSQPYDRATDLSHTLVSGNLMNYASSDLLEVYATSKSYDGNRHLERIPTSVIQKLADINVGLHKCASDLPSKAKADEGASSVGTSRRQQKLFIFDELFRLTTDFIEVMRGLCVENQDDQRFSARLHKDEAIVLMILSCHCLLVELYASVFHMMRACIECSLLPHLGNNWAIILPQLQVGPLVASSPVHVDVEKPLESTLIKSMYMLMITTISSQLWERLGSLIGSGIYVPLSTLTPWCALTDMMLEKVADRTQNLFRNIDAMKNLLQQSPAIS